MPNTFLISDTHFSHAGTIFKFKGPDGNPLRDFKSVEEMDEHMVERWNSVVRPQDRVYHLGDVAMRKNDLHILYRLNGKKKLLFGNHDIFGAREYLQYFEDCSAYKVFDGTKIIASHIPIAIESRGRFRLQIHGHLHKNTYTNPFYYNVCVEQIDYTPIPYDDILKYMDRYIPDNDEKGEEM